MLEEHQEKFPQLSGLIQELKVLELNTLDRYVMYRIRLPSMKT